MATKTRSNIALVTAEAFLEEFGADCGERLDTIASSLGLRVQEVDATAFDGALVRVVGSPVGTIAIRQSIPEVTRKRFTLAHELGHYLLPNQQGDPARPCAASSVESWDRSLDVREIDANQFAAEILMPRVLVGDYLGQQPTLDVAREIATRFNASLTASVFRLVELSSYRVAMAVARDHNVAWYRTSDEFGRAVRTGPLDKRTLAYDLFDDGGTREAGDVAGNAWLFEQNLQEGATLSEDSVLLRSYGVVLTLLNINERIEVHTDYDEDEGEALDPEEFTLRRKRWPR